MTRLQCTQDGEAVPARLPPRIVKDVDGGDNDRRALAAISCQIALRLPWDHALVRSIEDRLQLDAIRYVRHCE